MKENLSRLQTPLSRMLIRKSDLEVWSKTPVVCTRCGLPAFFMGEEPPSEVFCIWDGYIIRPDGEDMVEGDSLSCYFCGASCRGLGYEQKNKKQLEMIADYR